MDKPRFGALVLAAGFSSRMDGCKALQQIGDKTMLEHAVRLFTGVGIKSIVTVLGYRSEELIPAVEAAGSSYVINSSYHQGMFSSIQRGVEKLQDICDAFFLLPVDIPLVLPDTVKILQDSFRGDPSILVCYPQFNSRRGHPPLINILLARHVLSYGGKGGMRRFLHRFQDLTIEVQVDDPAIHLDADSPDDLNVLRKTHQQRSES
jgi:molybdenum cofactor cytidylyltransferase